MSTSRGSPRAPCFCGSCRAFKHCCRRSMTQVQIIRQPNSNCRWRIWRVHASGSKFATREVAEHACDGEFLWIARETADGTTWMIDDCPVTFMEVIDHVPPAMAEWVIDQTLAGLGELLVELVGVEIGDDGKLDARAIEANDQEEQFARMAGLMTEFMQFAHAGSLVADKLESLHELVERERGARSESGRPPHEQLNPTAPRARLA